MSDQAVSRERAFVSAESEKIEQAATRLRRCTFLSPGDERSAIVAEVVEALEASAEALRSKI